MEFLCQVHMHVWNRTLRRSTVHDSIYLSFDSIYLSFGAKIPPTAEQKAFDLYLLRYAPFWSTLNFLFQLYNKNPPFLIPQNNFMDRIPQVSYESVQLIGVEVIIMQRLNSRTISLPQQPRNLQPEGFCYRLLAGWTITNLYISWLFIQVKTRMTWEHFNCHLKSNK